MDKTDEARAAEVSGVLKQNYFDRAPVSVITAEQVRLNKELSTEACEAKLAIAHCPDSNAGETCDCTEEHYRWVLQGLLNHPGMNAASKAVVEAALEPWPASPTT